MTPSRSAEILASVDDRGADGHASTIGAREHVTRLYREQSGRLLRRLARELGCQDTARDVAQETFAKFLKMGPSRILGIERPEAFLQKLATNLLRDRGRGHAVSARAAVKLEPPPEFVDQVVVLESRDTLRRLERAIAELKPKTRRIFLAQRIDGLSYAEIAAMTGLSVKGVEKQMSKAIAKIDRLLDRD